MVGLEDSHDGRMKLLVIGPVIFKPGVGEWFIIYLCIAETAFWADNLVAKQFSDDIQSFFRFQRFLLLLWE